MEVHHMTDLLLYKLSFFTFIIMICFIASFYNLVSLKTGFSEILSNDFFMKRNTNPLGQYTVRKAFYFIALILQCVMFYFLPFGALPPFVSVDYAIGVISLLSLAYHFALYIAQGVRAKRNFLSIITGNIILISVFSLMSFYIYMSGIPGRTFSFESFTTLVLWIELPLLMKIVWFISLLTALYSVISCETIAKSFPYNNGFVSALNRTFNAFLITTVFMPFYPSKLFLLSGLALFSCDSFIFIATSLIFRLILDCIESWVGEKIKEPKIRRVLNSLFGSSILCCVVITLFQIYCVG